MPALLPLFVLGLCTISGITCDNGLLDCRPESLSNCIKLANPLLEDPKYVFPATDEDIDHVCNVLFPRTWSEFVSCIRQYTSECLSTDQKADFNRAVGDSINSVHKMCTNTDYKNDYLQHAECIKEKSVETSTCGDHYSRLVEQVKGIRSYDQRELCCTHNSFKECVLHQTEACACQPGESGCRDRQGMSAQGFARAMLDKALGFLLKQCQDYVPKDQDCPVYRRPVPVRKQPRFEEDQNDEQREPVTEQNKYEDGMYFPSGAPGRDDRREEEQQHQGEHQEGRGGEGWTNLSGDENIPDRAREEETNDVYSTQRSDVYPEEFERVPERDNRVDNDGQRGGRRETTERNFLFDPIDVAESESRPREDEWERTRKPWLPNLNNDIQSFDDLFSNAVEAQGRRGNSGHNLTASILSILLALVAVLAMEIFRRV